MKSWNWIRVCPSCGKNERHSSTSPSTVLNHSMIETDCGFGKHFHLYCCLSQTDSCYGKMVFCSCFEALFDQLCLVMRFRASIRNYRTSVDKDRRPRHAGPAFAARSTSSWIRRFSPCSCRSGLMTCQACFIDSACFSHSNLPPLDVARLAVDSNRWLTLSILVAVSLFHSPPYSASHAHWQLHLRHSVLCQ